MLTQRIVEVDGHSLTIEQVIAVARHHHEVQINPETFAKIERFRQGLEAAAIRGDIMYGVNTGCGSRKNQVLPSDELSDYQMRYIPAHCCGYGNPLPPEVTRAAMLVRLNNFLKGHSGVRPCLIERLRDCLNLGLTPVVPEFGSVGASGDLIPLAHMSAGIIGLEEGQMFVADEIQPARTALENHGLKPLTLAAKEAMALTNGANFIAAIACLAVVDGWILLETADLATALSLEAIRGEQNAFDARIHEARPLPGQVHSAARIRKFTEGSRRITEEARSVAFPDEQKKFSHGKQVPRVQDAYSFRCAPQIHAAAYQALSHLESILEVELNSATDNPLVFEDGENGAQYIAISGGNFHGQPLAAPLDYLAIALTPLAGASDRRGFALTTPRLSYGLPADLAGPNTANTGLMIVQYGVASLVNQIALLANPCSTHSITTSADQEDWVSMGMNSALKVRSILPIIRRVLAAELFMASQGITLTQHLLPENLQQLGLGTGEAYGHIRGVFQKETDKGAQAWFNDRYLKAELDAVEGMLADGSLLQSVCNALTT
ncbi:MAG: aromatic amino acid ammonia-lyase [Candidatus Doudnabacteria bacterium]|nr:aromatic amino acid ammonia-lyase [Candidatus Doudnabacteria bacterium]